MKAGAEAHFLAGQIFTLVIAAMAVLPRMPSDDNRCSTIGGKLSHPFRRALLGLVVIGLVRVIGCHLYHADSHVVRTMDSILGTVHVLLQSFLCLTTAYLLQRQLSQVVNIDGGVPGRSLIVVTLLTVSGAVLSATVHPNLWSLVNLAEAYSTLPVLKTLKLYATITTAGAGRHHHGRGPVLVQILVIIERWYLISSLLSFVGEAAKSASFDTYMDSDDANVKWLRILFEAFRQNQDNGIDDWSRLMMHSVFLNSIDELQHFTSFSAQASAGTSNNWNGDAPGSNNVDEPSSQEDTKSTELNALVPRRGKQSGDHALVQYHDRCSCNC